MFYFKRNWLVQGHQHYISAKSEYQEPVSTRHLSGTVCSCQVLSVHHTAMSGLVCFQEVTQRTGSRGKLVTLWTFRWECKLPSNSLEFYHLTKDSCKHRPCVSWEKNQELYHEGKTLFAPSQNSSEWQCTGRDSRVLVRSSGLVWPHLIELKT